MNAQQKYFTYAVSTRTYTEDINGSIPGLVWTDENGHVYRAIVLFLNVDLIQKTCRWSYNVFMQPLNTEYWLSIKIPMMEISNMNFVDASTGMFIDNPYDVIPATESVPEHIKLDDYPSAMPQFDYFAMLVGKNTPNVPISLYYLFNNEISKVEGLTII